MPAWCAKFSHQPPGSSTLWRSTWLVAEVRWKKFRHKSALTFFSESRCFEIYIHIFSQKKVQLKLDIYIYIYRIYRLSRFVGRVSGTKVLDFSMLLERGITIFRALILGQFFQIELSIHRLVSWNLPERLHSVLGPVSGSEEDLHRLRHGAVFIV